MMLSEIHKINNKSQNYIPQTSRIELHISKNDYKESAIDDSLQSREEFTHNAVRYASQINQPVDVSKSFTSMLGLKASDTTD